MPLFCVWVSFSLGDRFEYGMLSFHEDLTHIFRGIGPFRWVGENIYSDFLSLVWSPVSARYESQEVREIFTLG